jgi:hypothetical protein
MSIIKVIQVKEDILEHDFHLTGSGSKYPSLLREINKLSPNQQKNLSHPETDDI